MVTLGLTGSIGMGKSTTAQFFRDSGVPVHDSDAVVHQLYRTRAVDPISTLFPDVIVEGVVDRKLLSAHVLGAENADNLRKLEAIIHPMVRDAERSFLGEIEAENHAFCVLDIPLLFEVGRDKDVDKILVVTAPLNVQRERVLARPGMTEEKFAAILGKQMPDAEKRKRADFVIDTSLGFDHVRQEVRRLVEMLNV